MWTLGGLTDPPVPTTLNECFIVNNSYAIENMKPSEEKHTLRLATYDIIDVDNNSYVLTYS